MARKSDEDNPILVTERRKRTKESDDAFRYLTEYFEGIKIYITAILLINH